ncbi:MAG: TetR/AcrR family transcriptional regulator [Gaiellaceae bacterium]
MKAAADASQRRDGRRPEARGTARERLLDAAAHVFAEKGYLGASIDDIARAAGVTKGALYWNFPSKQEFFYALLDERVDRQVRSFLDLLENATWDKETIQTVSRGLIEVVDDQRELFLLIEEYRLLAVREPELRGRYLDRIRALRDGVARAMEAREQMGIPLTMGAQELATGMAALANGLVAARIVDPESVPDDLLGEMLDLIYEGLAARAARQESAKA